MLVPRSFHHAASQSKKPLDEKSERRRSTASKGERRSSLKPASPARTTTEPARVSTPPIPVRMPERTQSAYTQSSVTATRSAPDAARRRQSAHDPNALPPAVAALLAVTHIPRPKPGHFQRRNAKRISIDELVSEWKNDDTLTASYSSSPGLSILLENGDDLDESYFPATEGLAEHDSLCKRSTSSDSVPSLDADDTSILSNGSPSTPESLRSKRSLSNLKKSSPRSVPTAEECEFNHPLLATLLDETLEEDFIFSPPSTIKTKAPAPKSTFTSNLTTSLQALKTAALNSISSLSNPKTPQRPSTANKSPFSDDVLWSHPFLFPRFSPEIRPATGDAPTKAQRRYLNPTPLTFEEQEAPYQQALHAPYLAQRIAAAPTIPMQTYGRGGKRGRNGGAGGRRGGGGGGPDPQSEAGRALLGAAGVRQREIRENSDFLRVVVLEMNMKRNGKLETGKAKIWLPPRQVAPAGAQVRQGKVPRRWVGETAY